MEHKQDQNNSFRVYFIHENGTHEGEKLFERKEDAHSYAKKLMGAELSDISPMTWDEQKEYLEAILDIPIRCSQENFLLHFRKIGITEEEIQCKIDKNDLEQGNCAIIEEPNSSIVFKWDLAFDFEHGLHYVVSEY